jgi:hypothetical protein
MFTGPPGSKFSVAYHLCLVFRCAAIFYLNGIESKAVIGKERLRVLKVADRIIRGIGSYPKSGKVHAA